MQAKIIIIDGCKCHYIIGGIITLASCLKTGRFVKVAPLQAKFEAMRECTALFDQVTLATRAWVSDTTKKIKQLATMQNKHYSENRESLLHRLCNAVKYFFMSEDSESIYVWFKGV